MVGEIKNILSKLLVRSWAEEERNMPGPTQACEPSIPPFPTPRYLPFVKCLSTSGIPGRMDSFRFGYRSKRKKNLTVPTAILYTFDRNTGRQQPPK